MIKNVYLTDIKQNYFTWGQLIGYGLKLMLAALSGGSGNGPDGIDREDTDPNPMKVNPPALLLPFTLKENKSS